MRRICCHAVVMGLIAFPMSAVADVWHVDVDAPISGDGHSWCGAFTDLQSALAIAQTGDEVRVANGTYTPDQGTGNVQMAFEIPSGVRVLGGYAGCGSIDPDRRDPAEFESILSGDLNDDDGPDFTHYDDNSFNVIRCEQASSDTLLEGFTVSGGNADGPLNTYDRGGGMFNRLGGPTIRTCIFRDNAGTYGGGLINDASDATIIDCQFKNNLAVAGGGAIWGYNSRMRIQSCRLTHNDVLTSIGGAIHAFNCELAIDDTLFDSNGAAQGSGAAIACLSNTRGLVSCTEFRENTGGVLYFAQPGAIEYRDCQFNQNTGTNSGVTYGNSTNASFVRCQFLGNTGGSCGVHYDTGGSPMFQQCRFEGNASLFGAGGAMILLSPLESTLDRCEFSHNISERGGAIYTYGSGMLKVNQSLFLQNTATQDIGGAIVAESDIRLHMLGCRFMGNVADSFGGALFIGRFNEVRVANCIFSGNQATEGGAVYNNFETTTTFSGCTFTQNHADYDGDGVYNVSSNPTFDNCVFWNNGGAACHNQMWGGSPQVDFTCMGTCWDGTGNISADPQFIDADGADNIPGTLDDDLRLAMDSPCLNAGSSGLLLADFTDADNDGDTNESTPIDVTGHARVLCGEVDMGANEAGIGDYDCDGFIGIDDFTQWQACMTGPNNGPYPVGCDVFDFELDNDVDAADYAAWQRIRSIP